MLALTSRSSAAVPISEEDKQATPPTSSQPAVVIPITSESSRPDEKSIYSTANILEKPTFIPPKPISHSPKISPSSIPNPNPSVTTTKQVEPGYPTYGGFMYSVPGYSAFQPVAYPGIVQPTPVTLPQKDSPSTDSSVLHVPIKDNVNLKILDDKTQDVQSTENVPPNVVAKSQSDFEDRFVSEVISSIPKPPTDVSSAPLFESKISTAPAPLSQTSLSASMPSLSSNKELIKKKPPERFSLKTSIPISKIDIKCVNNTTDSLFLNNANKKPFNPAFHTPIKDINSKVEIQSNIVIKSAQKESEVAGIQMGVSHNSISTLINAAEAINKSDSDFKKPEITSDPSNDLRDSSVAVPASSVSHRPIFNPMNIETSNTTFETKTTDSSFADQKNQILFIQNKNPPNQKMLLTFQQQNPQVLVQRTCYDSKNLQAPSRPSNQSKKCKEELVNENGKSSKVVSLKRLHQENCDENDFENLITENQIYGNKIVVKEKSQGTSQEQGLKTKNKTDKTNQVEPKNVVLQPNFLYLSNVQFPANLMMIKNNKMGSDNNKNRTITNDKANDTICNNPSDGNTRNTLSQSMTQNKEIHVLKSNNNILQSFPNKNTKQDIVFQTTNQKVIMNPQIVYQVPMIVDADSKINPPFVNNDFPKIVPPSKKEFQKPFEQSKNEKLFIACPYQMDSKLQPKIVITNLRPKIAKIEEISSLDIYEKRKRLRRLRYLTNRENKSTVSPKAEVKKAQDSGRNIITPDKMKTEIYKELTRIKVNIDEESSGSDTEYAEDEMEEYKSIITQYGKCTKNLETQDNSNKAEFLAIFKLATQAQYKEKILDRQERILRKDAVVSAYIAAGRLDCIAIEEPSKQNKENKENHNYSYKERKVILEENTSDQKIKQSFLTNLHLTRITEKSKADYEAIWEEIVKERKRRGHPMKTNSSLKLPKLEKSLSEIDTNDQLQILTEIKKHVTDNNNLIKKRIDSFCCNGESIKILAEKNISELSRLSKMADRSVKLFSGQDTKKRDLNPGFDSENIQGAYKFYPDINIPNVSKIISLKSEQTTCTVLSAPATSMDEPSNCAAGVDDVHIDLQRTQDFACQVDEPASWPGVEALVRMYKEHDIVRKKEMAELHKRNTQLRVESAHITRAASRDSDRARHLLAERRNLASEEHTVRTSLQWLYSIVDLVRNYEEKKC